MNLHFKPYWHIRKPGNLGLLEISHTIRTFGINLIVLFIPIYLLQLGFNLEQVFFHYFIKYISALAFVIPVLWLYTKISINWVTVFNIPLNIFFLYLINQNPTTTNQLILLSIVAGIATEIYWFGFYLEFNKDSDNNKIGKEISGLRILFEISKTLSPLFGGLILGLYSFNILFLLSSFILILSGIPLIIHRPEKLKINIKKTIQHTTKIPLKYKASIIAHGIDEAASLIIWPLFIYLFIIESFIGLGAITTLSFVLVLIVIFFAGRLFDSQKSTLKIGSISNSIIWFIKTLAETISHAIGLNLIQGLAHELLLIPYHAKINQEAKKESDNIAFFVNNEFLLTITKGSIFLILIFLPIFQFESVFILAAVSSLVYYKL